MRRTLISAAATATTVLILAGCGGSSGATIAQRCHALAVRITPVAWEQPMRPAIERRCNQHPKVLTIKSLRP